MWHSRLSRSRYFIPAAILGIVTIALRGGNSVRATVRPQIPASIQREVSALEFSVRNREYQASVPKAKQILETVQHLKDPGLEIRVRRLLGAAQIVSKQYYDALLTLLPARDLAIRMRNSPELYRINNNLGWIYVEMNNLESAAQYADEALVSSRSSGKNDPAPMILRGFIYAKSGDIESAERLFFAAIDNAEDSGDLNIAAAGWHFLGASYLEAHRLPQAETAEMEAFHLRKLHHLPDLDQSLRDLSTVLAQEGDLRDATVLMDEALATAGDARSAAPVWYFFRARGELRKMKGDLEHALPDLRSALDLARRLEVVPTDDDRVTFESGLADLYSSFIDVGNRLYLKTHNQALKAEIFEAAEENRAVSLRAVVPQPNGWRTRLPAEHAETLALFQNAERKVLVDDTPQAELEVRDVRATLNRMEARTGERAESGGRSALQSARSALDPESALLAFHLGPDGSWIWAVTDRSFEVYPIAPKAELASAASRFLGAIRSGESSLVLGQLLGEKMFGQLPEDIHRKPHWILALDQDLFDLPIGAIEWRGGYLADQHSLLIAPSISLMEPVSSRHEIRGRLVGMGDPIYNFADSRWRGDRSWFGKNTPALGNLARLQGSGDEVRSAVAEWGSGTALTGAAVSNAALEEILRDPPAILHFATHVIKSSHRDRAGMIVLSLNSQNEPDLLDMRGILLHPAQIPLVVMSGCASGDGAALPATGLMGLTRAWLGAGVGEILATRWPSLDDNGAFFRSFYRNLRENPRLGAPEALHLTQREMIHSLSFRASPEYWASYFLIGKA